ncbi:glycosyltransferase family 39 protein [Streptomyces sp. NPDC056672]|uniref:glycosyltransferase family 39 protein n=1 Tax=Streptomyces sp. NPDC056672 TaxID=3345906 RepID=UPI003677AD04
MAHRSVTRIWHTLGHADAVHGLHYLLMHGVFALWDGGETALRLPSVLAVATASAGVALIGRGLAGPRAGVLAGLVFPLIPTVQRYAQEGRSYALVCALITWSTWLLLIAVSRRGRLRWGAYAAFILTACLLHELAVVTLFAHGATVFRSGLPHPVIRAWGIAAGCVTVGLLPLAAFSVTQSEQVDWIGFPDLGQTTRFVVAALLGLLCARTLGRTPPRRTPPDRTPAESRALADTRAPADSYDSVDTRAPVELRTLALSLLILPTVLLVLLTPLRPLYVDRYVLSYTIGLALLIGAALDRIQRDTGRSRALRGAVSLTAAGAALAALFPVGAYLRTPQSRQNDADAVARVVREAARPGDGVLFMPARRRVWTLARPEAFRGLSDLALERSPVASDTLHGTEFTPGRIRARVVAAHRIVAVHDLAGQPLEEDEREAAKRETLRTRFEECGSRTVTQARITVYARPGSC